MPHVSDFVNDLSHREREELDKTLLHGEQVRWATRPQPQLWCFESLLMFVSSIPGLIFLGIWTHGALGFPDTLEEVTLSNSMTLPALLISIPLWATILYFITFPWRRQSKLAHSLYLLTNRRALVLEPALFSRTKTHPYQLTDNMVLERHAHSGGRGDLIFAIERHRSSKGGTRTYRYGFKDLPNLERAEHELTSALAARHAQA